MISADELTAAQADASRAIYEKAIPKMTARGEGLDGYVLTDLVEGSPLPVVILRKREGYWHATLQNGALVYSSLTRKGAAAVAFFELANQIVAEAK